MSQEENLNSLTEFRTKKLQISDDEIIVDIPMKKTGFWGIIVSVIIFVGVVSLAGFVGGKYSHLFHSNFAMILGLLTGFFFTTRLNWLSQKQYTIVIDKKHIIIHDTPYRYRGRVYKTADIRNWSINPNYRLTPWTDIRAFLTKGAGGCIAFNYAEIKMPVCVGYGLTPSEAEELLEIMREKGWIKDFQLSDTALEYKQNTKMKYAGGIVISLFFILLILMVLLKQPYLKAIFPTYIVFSIALALFAFTMAIISYRQNKKR